MLVKFIESLGDRVIRLSLGFYDFVVFFFYCLGQTFLAKSYTKASLKYLFEQIYLSGIKNLFYFILLALFFGSIIIALAISFAIDFNLMEQLGDLLVLIIINEFTPFFTTLFFILSYSLLSKEKVEILKKENDNIINQIYIPKLINSVFIVPLLALFFVTIMLGSGYITSSLYLNIDLATYRDLIVNSIEFDNLLILFIKSSIFGFISMFIPIYFTHKNEKSSSEVTKSMIKTLITIVTLIIIVELLFAIVFY